MPFGSGSVPMVGGNDRVTTKPLAHRIQSRLRRWRHEAASTLRLITHLQTRRDARRRQRMHLETLLLTRCSRVVIFLVPESRQIRGGTLQILSMHRLSSRILAATGDAAVVCWMPGHGRDHCTLAGHSSDVVVCGLPDVLAQCQDGTAVTIHLPEFAAERLVDQVLTLAPKQGDPSRFRWRFNILNQRDDRMPDASFVTSLAARFPTTITTGHPDWSSPEAQARWGVPIHWVPTWYCLDDAPWQPYETKRDLLIVSPDRHPHRDRILSVIRDGMPHLETKVIEAIPFDQYTQLERDAKWSLTFGEGNDGYFYGTITRGGISFAVRNDTFNGRDLTNWITVYPTYQVMAEKIVADMRRLDQKNAFESYNALLRPNYVARRSAAHLEARLRDFYDGRYLLHPWYTGETAAKPTDAIC
jgi:hypothetical protein